MVLQIVFGMLPIILGLLVITIFVSYRAKKANRNPYLWGLLTAAIVLLLIWQHLPRWAGNIAGLQTKIWQTSASEPRAKSTSTALDPYLFDTPSGSWQFRISPEYEAEYSPETDSLRITIQYPTAEPSPRSTLKKPVVKIFITVGDQKGQRSETYLKIKENASAGSGETIFFVAELDGYKEYRRITNAGIKKKAYVFNGVDGNPVVVEERVFGFRASRQIKPYISVEYQFWPESVGVDFRAIDKVVLNFVEAHLEKNKEKK